MPLTMVKPGFKAIIQHIDPNHCHIPRLQSIGLFRGAALQVLASDHGGPLLIKIRGATLALGHDIAAHITVSTERSLFQ